MQKVSIEILENPRIEDIEVIEKGLGSTVPDGVKPRNHKPLIILIKDSQNKIVGGLEGGTYWGWLNIRLLWISDEFRDLGYGKRLVKIAEECAVKRGCGRSVVDTFSFQAKEFYEKIGYEVFGVLDDFPDGHKRFYMQKRKLAK